MSKKPPFKSEEEEAEWCHSPAGRAYEKSAGQKVRRQSRLVVDEKLSIREAIDLAKSTGKRIVLRNGSSVEPTDPVTLQELVNRVKAKGTQPVSLRLPVADLEAAKKIAEKTGIGYQTVLKELIHEALQRVS